MNASRTITYATGALVAIGTLGFASLASAGDTMDHSKMDMAAAAPTGLPANQALSGTPMKMSPYDLPNQFRTQLRGDVANSTGTATLKQVGKDVEYTFAWQDLTSNVISAHFHNAPHGQVGVREKSICGVAGESPACPTGKSASISGVWKDANIAAFNAGDVTIAFHTEVYPAPIGEIAVYIPKEASKG